MKIYRFVSSGAHKYRFPDVLPSSHRWWPDHIELGDIANEIFPKTGYGVHRWPFEGNRFSTQSGPLPLPDFPAFSLSVPVMSVRARSRLCERGVRGLNSFAEMWIDEETFHAVQPPTQMGALDLDRSVALEMPDGEPLYYFHRWFREDKITADIFWLDCMLPFSDVYVTERFVEQAAQAGLLGLECTELVYADGQPCLPMHPVRTADELKVSQSHARNVLEHCHLYSRMRAASYRKDCEYWEGDLRKTVYSAQLKGMIPIAHTVPKTLFYEESRDVVNALVSEQRKFLARDFPDRVNMYRNDHHSAEQRRYLDSLAMLAE
jgi:hypothetical protein